MAFYKMRSAFLIASLISIAAAQYHYENYQVYNFDADQAEPYRKPWFLEDYASPFGQPKSGGYAQSENAYESVAEQKTPQVYENPAEAYFAASTKKVPNEDKSFKKAISPFYTLTDTDPQKYKSIILKSGAPYCQEIKNPAPKKRFRRDAMTCYKCKDPKNGATYEQCSYTSATEPQETVQHEEYVPLSASLRYRRSNENANADAPASFRFGEEYFTPPVAATEATAESKKRTEKCEKVFKNSMICMVCTNPETHGKYEQCSYTNQPDDKSYAYSKSSSFGLPHDERNPEESRTREKAAEQKQRYTPRAEEAEETEVEDPALDKYFEEQTAEIKARTPKYKTFEPDTELESGSENVKDGKCKKITKDNMTCMVCKDPKTGGNYEQCSYAHNPSDKVYQVSKSKSFGYPEGAGKSGSYTDGESSSPYGSSGSSGSHYGEPKENDKYESGGSGEDSGEKYNYDQPSEKQETQEYVPYKLAGEGASAEHVKSESERISEEVKNANCEKVKKDSMTCMVCKDPKTGGNYEQCSYAYEPSDKLFSFSRAKSFGSPEEGEQAENPGSESYTDQGSYGLASDTKPYVASEAASPAGSKVEKAAGIKDPGNLAIDFFNTAEKKKEIEKVLSEFQQEDRSKCKKVIRDKLTCFQCTDKDGAQKEECIFVAAQEPAKDRVAYREVKEYQRDPKPAAAFVKPVVSKRKERKARKAIPARFYAEPILAASDEQEEVREAEEAEDDFQVERENVEKAETEPYDYAAATKPTYDKVLGITLPRYMLTTSEHEAEFDEVVASSRI